MKKRGGFRNIVYFFKRNQPWPSCCLGGNIYESITPSAVKQKKSYDHLDLGSPLTLSFLLNMAHRHFLIIILLGLFPLIPLQYGPLHVFMAGLGLQLGLNMRGHCSKMHFGWRIMCGQHEFFISFDVLKYVQLTSTLLLLLLLLCFLFFFHFWPKFDPMNIHEIK